MNQNFYTMDQVTDMFDDIESFVKLDYVLKSDIFPKPHKKYGKTYFKKKEIDSLFKMLEEVLPHKEVIQYLGISQPTWSRWKRTGKYKKELKSVKIHGHTYYFDSGVRKVKRKLKREKQIAELLIKEQFAIPDSLRAGVKDES